jgi:integrase
MRCSMTITSRRRWARCSCARSASTVRLVRRARLPRRKEVRPLAPSDVERTRTAAEQGDAVLFSVLAYAGLWPGEALALQWHDIRDNTILVERALSLGEEAGTKTTAHRTVRLLAPLRADLAEWRLASGRRDGVEPVFPNHRGGAWTEAAYRSWRHRRARRPAADPGRAGDPRGVLPACSLSVPQGRQRRVARPSPNAKKPRKRRASPEVELGGLEPPTSWVRSRRSPN